MITTYRYKMKPTKEQEAFFIRCFGCARFVYNRALSERISAYSEKGESMSFFDQCTSLRALRKQDGYSWLNEVPALSLNYSLLNLSNAYSHFFRTKSGFPKYKSRKTCRDSVKFDPASTRYDFSGGRFNVRIPKLGWVALCRERTFNPEDVKVNSTTVSRDACGTLWCCVSVDDGKPCRPKAKVCGNSAVGLDMGISDFAVLSDGAVIPNMRFSESEERRIAAMQRGLARKRSGSRTELPSRRSVRFRTKLAKAHRRVADRRKDYLHKASTKLVKSYGTICIEDLNVKGMMGNRNLAGAIGSVSWGEFMRMLGYKADRFGVNLLKVGRYSPTSQTCSVCGFRNAGTKDLSVREWTCPQCGTHHDRDLNAAKNIKRFAVERYFNETSPAVTGITDADGADSESKTGTGFRTCDYASDETSMQNKVL